MSLAEQEAVALLHVIVAMAKADGRLVADERKAIEAALVEAKLEKVVDAKVLFDDDFELDDHLSRLGSPEARDDAYRSAFSVAYVDGDCSKTERDLLDSLRQRLDISAERDAELRRLFTLLSGDSPDKKALPAFIADPARRGEAIRHATRQCAFISAVLGAFPIPGLALVTDLAVIALQVSLVRDIAALSGKNIDKRAAKALLTGVGVSGTRLAISNFAKLLPGWGSLVGATTSFASSYAVGTVFAKHFSAAPGGQAPAAVDRAEFKKAEVEGRRAYAEHKDEIVAKERASRAAIEELAREVKAGNLTQAELVERASMLP
jgi:uncharacterized protein (DUF697 family)/tellurite resistance protein